MKASPVNEQRASGKVSAADVAAQVFAALHERQIYIYTHPRALASVQLRLEDVVQGRNPSDPFMVWPEVGAQVRAALRSA